MSGKANYQGDDDGHWVADEDGRAHEYPAEPEISHGKDGSTHTTRKVYGVYEDEDGTRHSEVLRTEVEHQYSSGKKTTQIIDAESQYGTNASGEPW